MTGYALPQLRPVADLNEQMELKVVQDKLFIRRLAKLLQRLQEQPENALILEVLLGKLVHELGGIQRA